MITIRRWSPEFYCTVFYSSALVILVLIVAVTYDLLWLAVVGNLLAILLAAYTINFLDDYMQISGEKVIIVRRRLVILWRDERVLHRDQIMPSVRQRGLLQNLLNYGYVRFGTSDEDPIFGPVRDPRRVIECVK